MANSKIIELSFDNDKILVTANITFGKPIYCFSFSLNKLLHLKQPKHQDCDLLIQENHEKILRFRAPVVEYTITSDKSFTELALSYNGAICGWDNIVEDGKRSINYYSAWYPSDTNVSLDEGIVHIHNCEDYFVMKGSFDTQSKVWTYGGGVFDDCNIIAFKHGHFLKEDGANSSIYYTDPKEKLAAQMLKEYYSSVVSYYKNDLFGEKNLLKMEMVSLGIPGATGAYKRGGLIVFDCLGAPGDIDTIRETLAFLEPHEVAHEWCTGADTCTWDDWMNEGTAEWAALLYDMENNGPEAFDKRLQCHLDKAKGKPPIYTKDGHRVDEIHAKAVEALYPIYQEYGKDAVKDILRIFAQMPKPQTTELFLVEISSQLDKHIAQKICESLRS